LDILLRELDKSKDRQIHLHSSIDMANINIVDILSAEGFSFTGDCKKEGQLVLVDGIIQGHLKVRCSRCLTPADVAVNIPFVERFSEQPVEQEEEDEVHLVQGGQINLDPYFYETIFLEMPSLFFCREDCKGLCPNCGVDRNVTSCSCSNERIDPRLADLALFFEKNQDN
jgi:uncharacterized protein